MLAVLKILEYNIGSKGLLSVGAFYRWLRNNKVDKSKFTFML